ncbi:MAG: hypothetical protein HZC04_00055 [Candidatus Lloydbacteria bacterium]|nr:hypothetical protein [Candidatus Lloydbacteria bacterium]
MEPTQENDRKKISSLISWLKKIIASFSSEEKRIFKILVIVAVASGAAFLWGAHRASLEAVPTHGGSFTEGIIGTPRFINPLLAVSDADRDMTALVYSGLMRLTSDDLLIPDLAQSYTVSPNGLTYTFTLRKNIFFHDNTPVTSDDVLFTVLKTQESSIKSPRRASWDGVSVKTDGPNIVIFTLKQPYAPFLENTTLGILPKHIWETVSAEQFSLSQLNVSAIGSGPYQIKKITKNAAGIPEQAVLSAFKKFILGAPYISTVTLKFYPNEQDLLLAYQSRAIESMSAVPPSLAETLSKNGKRLETSPLPRVFGVFFNQNQQPLFANAAVRHALNTVTDRKQIISDVLHGYGTPLMGPLPSGSLGYQSANKKQIDQDENARKAEAISILTKDGWKPNPKDGVLEKKTKKGTTRLTFSIATSDIAELKQAAEMLKKMWEAIGAHVTLQIFEIGDLNQNIIRPRKYDALFFGEIIGRDADPFAFWHSSQRLDPGLNIALYANMATDKLLEEARTLSEKQERVAKYQAFQNAVAEDIPAVFTYAPEFIYVIPDGIKGFSMGSITVPADRFASIYNWYIETDQVWKIFTKRGTVANKNSSL